MKHLTKDINQLGRNIAFRVLTLFEGFEIDDLVEARSEYFVNAKHHGHPVGLKILTKASALVNGIEQFQIDDDVVKKINEVDGRFRNRRIVIVLVDTRTKCVSYAYFDVMFREYFAYQTKFPYRQNHSLYGPIWWNSNTRLKFVGNMSENERQQLIELRTKNLAAKNQKSIFDK